MTFSTSDTSPDTTTGWPACKLHPKPLMDNKPPFLSQDPVTNLSSSGTFTPNPRNSSLAHPLNLSPDITTSLPISLSPSMVISVSAPHGTRHSVSGTSKLARPFVNSLDTRKKSSQYAFLLITDKLFQLVLIMRLSFGIHWPTASIPQIRTIIRIGSARLDTVLNWRPQTRALLIPISLQSPGTEDWKFGTPISRLETLSSPMMDRLTPLLFLLMLSIWQLEEKIRFLNSGMSLTSKTLLDQLMLKVFITFISIFFNIK